MVWLKKILFHNNKINIDKMYFIKIDQYTNLRQVSL